MVPIGESIKEEVPSDTLQQREKSSAENHASEANARNGVTTRQPGKRGELPSIKTMKMEPLPDSATEKLQLNQGVTASPKTPKKGLQSPERGALPLQSGQEGSTPSTIREKVSEDGYNWRKYGQKLVKGNEYVRSYYRCTHPNCLVKKQLERLHDGQVVDIVYFGQHDHPKPQLNVPVAVGLVVSIVEERRKEASLTTAEHISADEHRQQPPQSKTVDIPPVLNISAKDSTEGTDSHSNKIKDEVHIDDDPDSKRQKKDRDSPKTTAPDKSTSEPRVIVQTRSEVDFVNDGYRWRKYGQKMVKGNPNPRSYYRCSNSGCPVKKHVERASHDPKMVMTTYEGQHNHDIPAARIVTHNVSGSNLSPTSHNGDSITKSDGNTNRLDMVVDAILEQRSKPKEEQNAKLTSGSASKDTKCSNVVLESCPRPQTKASKRQNSKSSVKEESDSIRSIPGRSRTSNNLVVKSSIIKSEGNNTCVVDMVVRDNIKTEQQNPDSEPVHG